MRYKDLGSDILENIGGKENINSLTHCATRLRFTLADVNKADEHAIKEINGVLGVAKSGGQFQVIIGQDVSHVYDEITLTLDKNVNNKETYDSKEESSSKLDSSKTGSGESKEGNVVSRLLDTISGIFTPILPAITGAAMIKTLLTILTVTNLMSEESQTYIILNFVGDAAFYFLPIMLAYSSPVKFKMNPYIAMTLGGILLHPTFLAIVEKGDPVHLFGLPVSLVNYGSSVIPIILVVWVASYVERYSEKMSPKAITFFMKPLLTLLIMTPIALVLVAPIGDIVGGFVGSGINFLNENIQWLIPFIFGIFGPIFIMLGMHYAVTIPITLQAIATYGFDTIGPGFLVANIAQGAAALAVARQVKNDTEFKALAYSAGYTALLGVTEPALYGVNLKLKKPFYAVLIAGGIGGLFVGLTGVIRLALAPTGLLTLPVFIDPENMWNIVFAIIGIIISFVLSYLLTTIFLKREKIIK